MTRCTQTYRDACDIVRGRVPPESTPPHDQLPRATGGPPEVLTVEEAAELLRLKPEQIRILARQGKIPGGKVGETWRFSRRALLRMVGEDSEPPNR